MNLNPKILLFKNGSKIESVDFGLIPHGESVTINLEAMNDSDVDLKEVKIEVPSSEVVIVQAPEELRSQKKEKLVLKYSPDENAQRGLNTKVNFKGIYVV